MRAAAVASRVRRDLGRSLSTMGVAALGTTAGIAALAFFLALGAGMRELVLERIFPVGRIEVAPPASSAGALLTFLGAVQPNGIDAQTVAELRALPGVRAVFPKMLLSFPSSGRGGRALLGHDIGTGEMIVDGIDPGLVRPDLSPDAVFADQSQLDSLRACRSDADCAAPELCDLPLSPDGGPLTPGVCAHAVTAVVSPYLVQVFDGAIAPAHRLPPVGSLLLRHAHGLVLEWDLGRAGLGQARQGRQRRVHARIVGVSPQAVDLGFTVPLDVAQRLNREFAGPEAAELFTSVSLLVRHAADTGAVTDGVERMGLVVKTSGAEQMGLLVAMITAILALTAVIVVLIAALNIAHVFFARIAERRGEIGLMRALGATRNDVRALVIAEAAFVGVVSSVLGIALARAAAVLVDRLSHKRACRHFRSNPSTGSFSTRGRWGWPCCLASERACCSRSRRRREQRGWSLPKRLRTGYKRIPQRIPQRIPKGSRSANTAPCCFSTARLYTVRPHGLDRCSRRANAQPEIRRRRDPAFEARRDYGPVGFGQKFARVQYDLCRGAPALRRIVIGVCAPAPRPACASGGGADRRALPGHRDRAAGARPQPAVHGGHRDRDRRLPAAALRARGRGALPPLRATGQSAHRPVRSWTRCSPSGSRRALRSWRRPSAIRKGSHETLIAGWRREGFVRARIDTELVDLAEDVTLDANKVHTIDLVIDRVAIKDGVRARVLDAVELALRHGGGLVRVVPTEGDELLMSERFACAECGVTLPVIEPQLFSFNSPRGACQVCHGLGVRAVADLERLVPDPRLSLKQGAIAPFKKGIPREIEAYARAMGVDLYAPWSSLPERARDEILHGDGDSFTGALALLEHKARARARSRDEEEDEDDEVIGDRFRLEAPCDACRGTRLRLEALAIKLDGRNIAELSARSIRQLAGDIGAIERSLDARYRMVVERIVHEIRSRLSFLEDVGLPYLSLDRAAGTLSGGEGQRVRLATQIGSALVGVLYVLDEPSMGLHPRDTGRLLTTLRGLVNRGNSVLVVEHDLSDTRYGRQTTWWTLGPGAGEHGGQTRRGWHARRSRAQSE